ncbi:glycosyltransferase family 2 protein [Rhodohalobacter sp. 614A]|uniref:glycosyltransferase family 2 protein n=1 Tax=Rhodohalobacter sp. 614A TaxID=2908649 RepID=UPI001F3BA39F|nr:glycosyltransferase family A protein [Rhodohalobacter sp. 614A]
MKSEPFVSAIITTKNRADLLPRALDSVLNQTYPNLGVIVVDDGSDDDTPQIIERYQEKHSIICIRNEQSLGANKARNAGIEKAKGEFVAGLDDDDEWHPERISLLLKNYDDSYACITSFDRIISSNRSVVWRKKLKVTLEDLLFSNHVGNQVLVKRERVLQVGGFDESLAAGQDYDLWIRLCEKFGPIKIVQEPLQNIYQENFKGRISNPKTQLDGYLSVYQKHKIKMNRDQKKYHLYNIRLAQGKVSSIFEVMGWVPKNRVFKEMKRWVANRYLINR